jgi:GDP-mannose pyrophosphatase NudK
MAQVKIREEKVLSDEHYTLKEIEYEIQKRDGRWETQKKEVFDRGNAVTVLLYNKDTGNIILTKQFRIATYMNGNNSGMLLETPAGLLEDNEAPEDAMIREIKEETGYAVPSVKKIFEAYTSAGSLTELVYFYVAPYNAQQKVEKGGGLEEEGEEINVIELPLEKAVQMIEAGEIRDVKTIMLVQYAQIKKLL